MSPSDAVRDLTETWDLNPDEVEYLEKLLEQVSGRSSEPKPKSCCRADTEGADLKFFATLEAITTILKSRTGGQILADLKNPQRAKHYNELGKWFKMIEKLAGLTIGT